MATRAFDDRHVGDAEDLFAQVGTFLVEHRLGPEPANYAFAFEIVANAGGKVAAQVSRLTEGGFRLSAQDIARLGGQAAPGAPVAKVTPADDAAPAATPPPSATEQVMVRALAHLEGFTDTVQMIHAEANEFGRDLQASAEAIHLVGPQAGVEEIRRLTGAMLARVRKAEARLESAQRESDELRAALEEARGSARTDPLTELPNRRAFDEAFLRAAADVPVTVAICDIDHFKRINDGFGHAVGDRVLRAVAQTLAGELGCMVARYGGEEFALLFDDADAAEAVARIDRARDAVERRRLRERETDRPIGTVSFSSGVASGTIGDGQGALMALADAALYRAKAEGRGRTVLAPPIGG